MDIAKYVFNKHLNQTRDAHKITTDKDIDHILKCGYFGKGPEIGDYSIYLGASDGGFLVVPPDDENLIIE